VAKKSRTAKKRSKSRQANAAKRSAAGVPARTEQPEAPVPAKKAPPAPSTPALVQRVASGPRSWWLKGAQFFREVKVELKKVTWPSRKETITSTSVVVVLVVIASVFLGLVDLGLSRLIRAVIG